MSTTNHERTPLLPATTISNSPSSFILPENEKPRSWSRGYRQLCVAIISLYGLMSPVMASAIVPALPAMSKDLGIADEAMLGALVSVYVMSWNVMPVVLGPLSEIYGRINVLHTGHALFLTLNLLSAFARTGPQLLVLRLLAGGVGSGPLSIGAGIIGDLWAPEERGVSIALYTLGPLLGPAVGPIAAAYISQYYSWRWIFGCSAIYLAATLVLALSVVRETYLPVITQRSRAAAMLANPAQHGSRCISAFPPAELENKRDFKTVRQSLMRPFVLLWTEPIIQVSSLFIAYLYGLNHLTLTTFQSLWRDVYGQSMMRASQNYFFIAAGFILGSQATGWIGDKIYRHVGNKKPNAPSSPEIRTYMMLPASLLVPSGLLLYGWAAERRLHWLVPDLGIMVFSSGIVMSYQCLQAYIIDCYTLHAASTMSALILLRSLTGFAFPLFAHALFETWGYGWGSAWLAGFAGIMGLAIPVLLNLRGPAMRARSAYADTVGM
ncbi:putative bicyclomycin resistance protein [Bombardia bombarda]|uniref:Bicyclomycin resistance protein n=1 Tax=Bombardia bombarda TaxID=252184 RepID=A0AA39X7I2_9PEZI|nr:putative bicyclomycin resistance protein [Bombardia bombarda]